MSISLSHPIPLSLILSGLLPMLAAAAPRLDLDPGRVEWRFMQLEARKFVLTAQTYARLEIVEAEELGAVLIPTDRGEAVPPGEQVALLDSRTTYFGKESRMQLHMAPRSARAIQYALDEDGDRLKHRIYRYTDTGIFVRTHRPVDRSEREQAWQTWTDLSTEWRTISEAAYGDPIVEPLGLLYVAGAAELEPGAPPVELLSISDRKVTRVRLTAHEAGTRRVNFELERPGRKLRCEGEMAAIRLEVDGAPIEAAGDASFEFLGLEDDIEIHVEPESRLVLEVSGKAPIVGNLVIRLKEAALSGPGGCPAMS